LGFGMKALYKAPCQSNRTCPMLNDVFSILGGFPTNCQILFALDAECSNTDGNS
jgi:hypothetical protein